MTEDSLYAASRVGVAGLIANGVTTVESKSGAGLDLDLPVTVISTFLGAHGLPPEFSGRRDDYIDFLCETVLPAAVQQGIVDQVDGFCDDVGFTHAQIGRLFARAASFGLPVKLHADQYSDFGAGAVVARHGGLSADHLEYASEETLMAMAEAVTGTVVCGYEHESYCLRWSAARMQRDYGRQVYGPHSW